MKQFLFFLLIIFSALLNAQNLKTLDKLDWILEEGAKKEVYKGQDCFNTNNGSVTVKDLNFKNGIIEYDMCIQQGRGFAGVRFHNDGKGNAEEFYIRKHQSGNPDAMQYTPVYNGNAGWQLYYGDGYGAVKNHVFDEWFKIKLVVAGTKGEVFIGDMEKPVLIIYELKMGERDGGVVFYGPARFANFKITQTNTPKLIGKFKTIVKAGNEVIQKYAVSETVNAAKFLEAPLLSENTIDGLKFTDYTTEADGLINLSKTGVLSQEKNTVLLKIKIDAQSDIIKPLSIGFSDAAKIFVNGKAVWFGMDNYRSRDYRFLGTIGYFDTIFLDLKKGENTIIAAVSESFGGWGFKAKFKNLDGIKILQ